MKRTGLIFAFAMATGGCLVSGQGSMGVEATTPAVVYEAPPAPQYEAVTARPGFVWISGRWNWQNGNWAWVGGHWERERAGYAWASGRWEQSGNGWHWVEGNWTVSSQPAVVSVGVGVSGGGGGQWNNSTTVTNTHTETNPNGTTVVTGTMGGGVTISAYPTAAPPPIRVENYGTPRSGFLWVSGRWDWQNGNWAWVDGHWERERANQVWIAGSWQLQGNRWVWVDGRWDVRGSVQPVGPIVRDHR